MFATLLVAVLALGVGAAPALASNGHDVKDLTAAKTGRQLVEPAAKAKSGEPYEIWYITDRKVENPKSSNRKVANAFVQDWGETCYLVVVPLKAGKTKLSFTYDGKKYATVYTVKNWKNPVKKFKVGKADITSNFDKAGTCLYNAEKSSFNGKKVNVAAASGWKLADIESNNITEVVSIKNGSKIPKKAVSVAAILQHIETGAMAYVDIEYDYE